MLKIDFQDGCCCGHLGFPISTILAIFDLKVILLLQCKFQFKCPTVWEEKSKIGFQDGGYGDNFIFPIGTIKAIFHLTCQPVATA